MQPRFLAAAGAALLVAAGPVSAQNVTVMVNGRQVQFENAQPAQIAGRVMIPLRGVLNRLGAERIQWRPARQEIYVNSPNGDMRLRIGERTALVQGRPVDLDVPPMIIQNTTMVPLRFVSENLGARVDWHNDTRTVYIATTGEGVAGRPETAPTDPTAPGREPRTQSRYLRALSPRQGSTTSDRRPEISVQFQPNANIDISMVRLVVNDQDVTGDAQITAEGVDFVPIDDLRQGRNVVKITFRDTAGVESSQEWFFDAP